jgi:hypothetical protein
MRFEFGEIELLPLVSIALSETRFMQDHSFGSDSLVVQKADETCRVFVPELCRLRRKAIDFDEGWEPLDHAGFT